MALNLSDIALYAVRLKEKCFTPTLSTMRFEPLPVNGRFGNAAIATVRIWTRDRTQIPSTWPMKIITPIKALRKKMATQL